MQSQRSSPDVKHSSQNGFVLWHGMRFSEMVSLLRRNPELHWSRWNRIAMLPGMACYNSLMYRLEKAVYGKRIEETQLTAPPVFILGFWRSGTTLLHRLMNNDPQFTSATMYRTLFPWHFLLTEKVVSKATGWLMPKSRPMDNVPMSWDAPQEDDIALCIMSLISCYTFLSTPEDFTEFWRALDFRKLTDAELQRWKDSLLLLMKKITLREQKQIVLKSPSHTYRIPTLMEMFPDAKFIYIYRHPYDVFRSAVHLRRTMIHENGLGRPVMKDVEQQIIKSYQAGFEAYERDRRLIPEQNLLEVRFEDLEENPVGEMARVYSALGLAGFDKLHRILEGELINLKRYRKNQFTYDLEQFAMIYSELKPAFDRFEYSVPEEIQSAPAAA